MKNSTDIKPTATIWCSSSELDNILFNEEQFACWLHISKKEWPEFEKIVEHLAEQGCSLIYISGGASKLWHDKADDCLIEMKREDVLTAWAEGGLEAAAEEFWDLTWRYHPKRLLAIVDDAQSKEHRLAAEIIAALGKQFA